MSQYVVVVSPLELPEQVQVFGPYKSEGKATSVAGMLIDPRSSVYYGEDEYDVYVVPLSQPDW